MGERQYTTVPVECVELVDEQSAVPYWAPASSWRALKAQRHTVTLIRAAQTDAKDWLTVTEAAKLRLEDCDGLDLELAKAQVSWAADRGKFTVEGEGRSRRIEPGSFSLWRDRQRRLSMEKADDEAMDERVLRKRLELGLEDRCVQR